MSIFYEARAMAKIMKQKTKFLGKTMVLYLVAIFPGSGYLVRELFPYWLIVLFASSVAIWFLNLGVKSKGYEITSRGIKTGCFVGLCSWSLAYILILQLIL